MNLNLNLPFSMAALGNGDLPYRPPQQSELLQWSTGVGVDNPLYPDYKYIEDTSGNGAFILHDENYTVVDANISDPDYLEQQDLILSKNKSNDDVVGAWPLGLDGEASIGAIDGVLGSGVASVNLPTDNMRINQFDGESNQVYTASSIPKANDCLSFDATTNAYCKVDGGQDLVKPENDWSVSIWVKANNSPTGYSWGVAGNTSSRRLGLYFFAGSSNFILYGTNIVFSPLVVGQWTKLTVTWNATTNTARVYRNGQFVIEQSGITPNAMNDAPMLLGGRYSVDDADGATTFNFDGEQKQFRIWDKVLTDDQETGLSFNPEYYPVIVGVGSSSMYGTGATTLDNGWFRQHNPQGQDLGICILNISEGGSTFYEGMYDGFEKPDYVTGARPAPVLTRNLDYAKNSLGADVIIFGYSTNYANQLYNEGPELYSEYVNGIDSAKQWCDDEGLLFYTITPQPIGVSYDVEKRNTLKATADYLNNYRSSFAVDFYNQLVDESDNTLNTLYDSGDEVHPNDAGHAKILLASYKFIPTVSGAATTYDINASGLLPTPDYPAQGDFKTQTDLAINVHNGTTSFIADAPNPLRMRNYDPATVLLPDEIELNLKKVWR